MSRLLNSLALGAAAWGASRLVRHLTAPTFRRRVVLITGGPRGLGLAMARRFAAEGARLVLASRTESDLEEARRELEAAGAEVLVAAADVTDVAACERLVAAALDRFGALDVLVNNAGVVQVGPHEHMSEDDFRQAMDVHFWAVYYLTRAALPHLERSPLARIVNVASIGGEVALPHLAPYAASKHALVGYSDTLRAELAPRGIRVTTVDPGLMRTGSHVNAWVKGQHAKEQTWFTLGMANPLLSTSADTAALRILEACRYGRPKLVLTLPAKLAVAAEALAPNVSARVAELAERLLPEATGPEGDVAVRGGEAPSALSPSPLTHLADRNVERFNEGGAG